MIQNNRLNYVIPLEDFISLLEDKYSQGQNIELISYCTELIDFDMETEGVELFESLVTLPRMYWSNPDDGTIISFGQIREFSAIDHKHTELAEFISKLDYTHVSNYSLQKGIKLFGGFSFDPNRSTYESNIWKSFPSMYFYIPRIIIEYIDEKWILSFNLNVTYESVKKLKSQIQALQKNFYRIMTEVIEHKQKINPLKIRNNKAHTSYEDWNLNIEYIKELVEKGKLQKLVLANSRKLELTAPLNIKKSLYYLHQHFPDAYIFLFEQSKHNIFLGATPELLIAKNGTNLETVALAGSRPRGIIETQDMQYGLDLLQSKKDNEEHRFVIDQICQKLDKLGISPEVSESPTIHKLKNIQHLKTIIKAKGEYNFLQLIKTLHPTAAVGGVPSDQAITLIPELEKMDRGWYSGPIGWMDGGNNGRIAVALRSSLIQNQTAHIYAGAGIVKESDAEAEWNEIGIKFQPMLRAIGAGRNTS